MSRKNPRNTRGRIVSAAWKLFYERGYEDTTVEEIIEESQTSKGSFYHYFEGKDALLSSLSYLFDEKYEELMETMDPAMPSFDKLLFLNAELFSMIEERISSELLGRLLSSQLITRGDKHLLNRDRTYFKVIRRLTIEARERGELRENITVNEFVNAYALCERALLYDWCLCGGSYSLPQYSRTMLPLFLQGFRRQS